MNQLGREQNEKADLKAELDQQQRTVGKLSGLEEESARQTSHIETLEAEKRKLEDELKGNMRSLEEANEALKKDVAMLKAEIAELNSQQPSLPLASPGK
jgi:seryl-tRNA synthetase